MFFTIYKITNDINKKFYIGKHQTKDLNDSYMGSGKHLKRAQEKYGIENFKKEILFIFDNEDQMNIKEFQLVTDEFYLREDTYNLCPGGRGGFGYINQNGLSPINDGSKRHKERSRKAGKISAQKQKNLIENDPNWVSSKSKSSSNAASKRIVDNGGVHWNKGKLKHTEEWKENHSRILKEKQGGSKNSQFDTTWVTNGLENKKIKKDDTVPEGWRKGRIINKNTRV